jgi:cytochrome c-type biogenesis protein CcmH/NrfG
LRSRLSRDPGNLNDLYALALAQALQRHAGDAAITLQQITQLDPGNANANLSLGLVQLYRFKPWAAEPPLSIAAELDPKNKTTKILRAVQQAMTGNWHSAVQLLR